MGYVPIHPALVHVPVGLALVVPIVALALAVAVWRGALPRRAWWVVVGLQAVLVVGAFAAMATGEDEGERVEPVVDERYIEEHERRAGAFVWTSAGVLAAAVAAASVPAPVLPAMLAVACLGTAADAVLAVWTGKAGGELVYLHGAGGAGIEAAARAGAVREDVNTEREQLARDRRGRHRRGDKGREDD